MSDMEQAVLNLRNAKRYIERAQNAAVMSIEFDHSTIQLLDAAAQAVDGVYNIVRLRAEHDAAEAAEEFDVMLETLQA